MLQCVLPGEADDDLLVIYSGWGFVGVFKSMKVQQK